MAFDDALADRVRAIVRSEPGIAEKRMFGGLAFMLHGNMSVGVHGAELIVRVAPGDTDAALKGPGVRIFDITGRPMKGWLLVGGDAVADRPSLARWVSAGLAFARTLPAK